MHFESMKEEYKRSQHTAMITVGGNGSAYYPDFIVTHCIRVLNYHTELHKDVQILFLQK